MTSIAEGTEVACFTCRHFGATPDGTGCAAFPDGIPELIYTGVHAHRAKFKGDRGIRYARDPDVADSAGQYHDPSIGG